MEISVSNVMNCLKFKIERKSTIYWWQKNKGERLKKKREIQHRYLIFVDETEAKLRCALFLSQSFDMAKLHAQVQL